MDLRAAKDWRTLVLLGSPALRALHRKTPFLPEEVQALKTAARDLGRCGSLDTQDGLPCTNTPRLGWTVCHYHGAAAPQTTRKAHSRLMETLTPGLRWLQDEWARLDADRCPTCGYPSGSLKERKHYATILWRTLDRVGLGPGKTINLNVGQAQETDALIEVATIEEREELRRYLAPVKAWRERMQARLERQVVVEGEVVQSAGGEGGAAQREDRPSLPAGGGQDLERWDRDQDEG